MNQIKICPCGIAADDCDYHKPQPVVNNHMANEYRIYDVCGISFIPAVTQFTVDNFQEALNYLQLNGLITHFEVHSALYCRIDRNYGFTKGLNGQELFEGIAIIAKPTGKTGNIFETDFCMYDQIVGKLITREA